MTNSRQKGARWVPVRGYEGLYEVNDIGEVKSLPRFTTSGKIMKLYHHPNGYVYVNLCKGNVKKNVRVHKIVIEAFTDYTIGSDINVQIDHIDGDKTNNRLDNLEVVTQSENMKRAYANGLATVSGTKVIDLDTHQVFDSYSDAVKSVGGNRGEMVARVCRGVRSHYRNHRFARLDDYQNDTIPQFTGKYTKKASEMLWL